MQKGTLHSKEVSTKPIIPSTSNSSECGAASWRIQLRNSMLYASRDNSITTTDWKTNRRPDPVGCSKGSRNLENSVRDEHPLTAERREDQKQRCLKKDNLTVLGKEEEECVTPEKQLMNKDDIVSPNAPARLDRGNLLDAGLMSNHLGAKFTYGNEASKADMRLLCPPLAEEKSERETSPVNRQISDSVICPKAPSGLAPSKEDMGDESLIAKEKSEEDLEAANKELLDLQDSKDEGQTNAGDSKQDLTVFHDDSSNMDFNGDDNKKDTHSAFIQGSLQMPSSQSVKNAKEKFERDLQAAKKELLDLQDFKGEGQTNAGDGNQNLTAFHSNPSTTDSKADANTNETHDALMQSSLEMPARQSIGIAINVLFPHSTKAGKFPLKYGLRYFR